MAAEYTTPVYMEATAREIAGELYGRFGAWLVADELSEDQRREGLKEVFAHVAHDGIMTGIGILHLTTPDDHIAKLELAAEVRGYVNGITDIDEGQGIK